MGVDMLDRIRCMSNNPPATVEAIKAFEEASKLCLPLDYKRVLLEANGFEGFVDGGSYLVLWSVDDLMSFNVDYEVSKHCPGLLLIGSDGSGEAFAIDFDDSAKPIVQIPFVGMSRAHVQLVARDFSEFIEVLSARIL